MKIRKMRRITRERTGRGETISHRTPCEYWKSDYNMRVVMRRIWVTTGNFWRCGVHSNFQH